jgi:anti-sigma regulatory factor (Ser/Thr protein kinase)
MMATAITQADLVLSVVLDLDDRSPGHARAAVRAHLAAHCLDADIAQLVVSELVTNAVQTVRRMGEPDPPHVGLTVAVKEAVVEVTVWDADPHPPVVAIPALDAENGRGLLLVAELAIAWDWYPCQGGKAVWVQLAAAAETDAEPGAA